MSSSKIIKAQDFEATGFSESVYQPVDFSASAAFKPAVDSESGFLPLVTNGNSEIRYGEIEEELIPEDIPEGPPAIMVTEEELDRKLRESFQSGLAEGKQLAERGLQHVFNTLRMAAEDLHALRDKVLRESEEELLKLTMLIARKVIVQEVSQDSGILLKVMRSALSKVSEFNEVTVYLHPDDLLLVSGSLGDGIRHEMFTEKTRLKPDPALLPGCCRVDTEKGTIDASFDAQLEEIYRHMLEERIASQEQVHEPA